MVKKTPHCQHSPPSTPDHKSQLLNQTMKLLTRNTSHQSTPSFCLSSTHSSLTFNARKPNLSSGFILFFFYSLLPPWSLLTKLDVYSQPENTTRECLPMASPGNQVYDLEHCSAHVYDRQIMIPKRKDSTFAESFEKKDRSWFVSSQIPTDMTVQIQDITFSFHKFPLQSRSGYMSRPNLHSPSSNYDYDIKMDNFPGEAETFELVLKFCYGISIDLTSTNVAPLRCAAEFLEMTEELEEGNLISKTEAFITFAVVTSWRNSFSVLKSCEPLSPWAENLQIIRRCSDSIAWKAARDTHLTEGDDTSDEQWWFDDVSTLKINYFVRILKTIEAKGMADRIIGACIAHYATKWLPGYDGDCEGQSPQVHIRNELQLSISSGWTQESRGGQNKEERMIIESLVSLLPPHREAVSCGFLMWLLKMAIVYSAAAALVTELEMRAGMAMEDATLDDLMIPNFPVTDRWTSPDSAMKGSTMHNVDTVRRIVEYFLMHEQQHQQLSQQQTSAKIKVGKLLDSYLAEIAADPNLSPVKFQALAEVLPGNARTCDDGLYRALDTYLKSHPSLTDHERRRLCRVMDNDKLSPDACFHAAQNERLPVRTVVQVLFTEQVKMKETMQRDAISKEDFSDQEKSWSATKQEVQNLKEEVEKMKNKVAELQQDYSFLHQEYDKLAKGSKSTTRWVPVWKKIRNSTFFRRRGDQEEERGIMQTTERGRTLRRASVG